MSKFLFLLFKLKIFFLKKIVKDKYLIAKLEFYRNDGPNLMLNYSNLNNNSIVFDIGGFEGDFAMKIFKKYNCNIYIFEPHPYYYNFLIKRFKGNSKIKIFNYGFGKFNTKVPISDNGASSSINILGNKTKIV